MAKNDNSKSKADKYREERKARLAKASKKSASKSEKSLRIQKIIQKTISIVIIVAIVAGIGWQIMGFTGATHRITTVMSVGKEKISLRDFNYYYILMYNYTKNQDSQYESQYGQDVMGFDSAISPDEQDSPQKNDAGETITWAQYLSDSAIDRAQQYEALYKEALAVDKTKYSLTIDEQKTLDDQIESIRSTAAKQNLSINSYLREFYGKGISEKFLRNQLEKETIVARYSDDKNTEFEAAWTDEKVNEVYNADKDSYDVVSLRVFSISPKTLTAETGETSDALAARQKAENDATKAKAESILNKINDEPTFISQATENKTVAEGTAYDADSETANFYKSKSTLESSISADAATWAFADGRSVGDKSVFQSDSGESFVVWVKTTQYPSITVDVRHILLSFKADTSDTTEATTEEIAAAKLKADDIYAQWQAGDKTEDSFAALATANSTDTGSKEKGGLYEDVAVGSMVAPFENWCFDPARKPGDTGIVKSTYGYHVMYMVNNDAANYAYLSTIRTDKATADNDSYVKALLADDKYKITKNNKNITNAEAVSLKIINTLIELEKSSSNSNSSYS